MHEQQGAIWHMACMPTHALPACVSACVHGCMEAHGMPHMTTIMIMAWRGVAWHEHRSVGQPRSQRHD